MPLQSPIPLADGSKHGEMGAGRAATAASRARPRASGVSARPRASSDGGHRRAAAVTAASRRPRASRGRACSDGGEQAMAPASLRAAFSSASLRCLFSSFRVVGSATAASTFSSSTAALPSSSSCHLAPREETAGGRLRRRSNSARCLRPLRAAQLPSLPCTLPSQGGEVQLDYDQVRVSRIAAYQLLRKTTRQGIRCSSFKLAGPIEKGHQWDLRPEARLYGNAVVIGKEIRMILIDKMKKHACLSTRKNLSSSVVEIQMVSKGFYEIKMTTGKELQTMQMMVCLVSVSITLSTFWCCRLVLAAVLQHNSLVLTFCQVIVVILNLCCFHTFVFSHFL